MGLYTNLGLVEHVKMAEKLKTAYMNSGILRPITTKYLNDTISRVEKAGCPASSTGYTESRKKYLREQIADKGFYGVDCVCLVKSYYWSGKANGGVGSPKYVGSNDVNAGVMYKNAKIKGPIRTMPDKPGIILYSATHPHVGVYIGNGETIESTLGSRGDGVVRRKLDNFWEYWFECPYIEYGQATEAPAGKVQSRVLSYTAALRAEPKFNATLIARLTPTTVVDVYPDTDTIIKGTDGKTYTYVRVRWNGKDGWIVKSALKA